MTNDYPMDTFLGVIKRGGDTKKSKPEKNVEKSGEIKKNEKLAEKGFTENGAGHVDESKVDGGNSLSETMVSHFESEPIRNESAHSLRDVPVESVKKKTTRSKAMNRFMGLYDSLLREYVTDLIVLRIFKGLEVPDRKKQRRRSKCTDSETSLNTCESKSEGPKSLQPPSNNARCPKCSKYWAVKRFSSHLEKCLKR